MKGLVVCQPHKALQGALERGMLTREVLESRLSPGALTLLEAKIDPARWYPAQASGELLEATWDYCLHRNVELALTVGRQMADDMLATGRYQQLEYARSNQGFKNATAAMSHTRLVGTVVLTLFDFLEPSYDLVSEDPIEIRLIYDRAGLFPELARFVGQGFTERVAAGTAETVGCTSERPHDDRVVMTLTICSSGEATASSGAS